MTENTTCIETDAVVIGAGPVGLYQAFQLGLLEARTHIVEALPYAGGQCIELYPDKPIYDLPGLLRTTGRELTQHLLQQIEPFQTQLHLGQPVSLLERQTDQRFILATRQGKRFLSKTIFIAAGMGAFQARTLPLPNIEHFEGTQIFYAPADNANTHTQQHVVLVGGGESALRWAVAVCEHAQNTPQDAPRSVTLVHRREAFDAPLALVQQLQALRHAGRLQFIAAQITALQHTDGRLDALQLLQVDGTIRSLPLDTLLISLGLSPKLGPIADWGLEIRHKQLPVDTETFATCEPGIFAVGDICTYPGKKKLLICGFHECVLAAFGAMAIMHPDKRVLLQYTTTSSKLHQLLGVTA